MQNKLAVLLLLLFALYVVTELIYPLHEQQQYYDLQIDQYVEGISV